MCAARQVEGISGEAIWLLFVILEANGIVNVIREISKLITYSGIVPRGICYCKYFYAQG